MRLGMTLGEARDMCPLETERYLAVAAGWRSLGQSGVEMVRPGVRKATQADMNRF